MYKTFGRSEIRLEPSRGAHSAPQTPYSWWGGKLVPRPQEPHASVLARSDEKFWARHFAYSLKFHSPKKIIKEFPNF